MFDKIISLTQPKEQFLHGISVAQNPYFDHERECTIYSFVLKNESIEKIDKLYMLIGNSIEERSIEGVAILETGEDLKFNILKTLKGRSNPAFNYLKLSLTHEQKKLRLLTVEITFKGELQGADLTGINNIFTLSIKNKLLPFYGDKFFVPRVKHKKELKLTKRSWKETGRDGKIILNYHIELTNFTGKIIPKLKIHEEFFLCKSSLEIQKLEINDLSVKLDEKVEDEVYRFNKEYQNLSPWEKKVILYKVFIKTLSIPGIYNFPSITKVNFWDETMEKSTSLQLRLNEIEIDSTCNTLDKSDTQFLVRIRNGEGSPSTDILLKDTIIIPKGIKINFDEISHMEMFNLGEKIEIVPEYLTDTILELTFKRRVENNSEIEIPICFKVVEIEGERTSDYIKNIVEEVKILNKYDSLNKIHYKNKKTYLKVSQD